MLTSLRVKSDWRIHQPAQPPAKISERADRFVDPDDQLPVPINVNVTAQEIAAGNPRITRHQS